MLILSQQTQHSNETMTHTKHALVFNKLHGPTIDYLVSCEVINSHVSLILIIST